MVTKTLDEVIDRSAAPAAVRVAFDRLDDAHAGLLTRLRDEPGLRDALVAVTAASRALTELCVSDALAVDALAMLDRRATLDATDIDGLRRWKRIELLRIAARDLLGLDDLPSVGAALASMASDVFETAIRVANADGLTVVGMGKLGGNELNYASDVDVMFVARDPTAAASSARDVMTAARACFRVDANLRPEGRDGPLVRSLDSYRAYWHEWAEPWEFQALLKARPVAGDRELGAEFGAAAREQLWARRFSPDDLRAIRAMKARAEGAVARRRLQDREIKRGRGGIRDIEFSVQLLQLVHGRDDPGLRSPTTLDALAELSWAGYVDAADADALDRAYRFLRTAEHRLQLVDEQQVHTVPAEGTARTRLARVMGYRDKRGSTAVDQFDDDLRRHQAAARAIHERLFFRPLLDAFAGRGERPLPSAAVEARLAAFGFTDAERTRQALTELTRGLTRSSRLMQQMLPLLLDWLSEAPDPDLGLLGLRKLSTGRQRTTELSTAFRESPEAARRLCALLGTSALLATSLEHHPDVIPLLGDDGWLAPRPAEELLPAATTALAWRPGIEPRQQGLLRFRQREELRIAARDVVSGADDGNAVVVTAQQLTALAEAAIEASLETVEPGVPFAVVAMGRFGGGELSYASDLDMLFVYDGTTSEHFAAAEAAATELVRFLKGPTPASRVYDVDLDLRPEGKDGLLARSLDGYREYYERWAETWERQALVKARAVAGDPDVGRRFIELVDAYVWAPPFTDDQTRQVRRMKARMERERIPAGEDPQFHLKLGRGSLSDIEFTAQLLQLQHRVPATGTMAALAALHEQGVLDDGDHEALASAYRFCERTRNRWFLIKGSPGDSLPTQSDKLTRLARSLETTPNELRERYRRVTRRARQVVQRLFYGNDGR